MIVTFNEDGSLQFTPKGIKGKNCTNVMAKDMFYLSSDNPNIKDSYNFEAIKPPNASDCASDKIGK